MTKQKRPATARAAAKKSGIWLDYGQAASGDLLRNISAAAMAGPNLWTASDEGRTIECLAPHGDGFRLLAQIPLDSVFGSLPGRDRADEADIESLAVANGKLWICGSHCRVRRNRKDLTKVDARFRSRPSRCLLGAVALTKAGDGIAGAGVARPFEGAGSLRTILGANPYIAPFIDLPSKENGLDIEGLCVSGQRLFLGLRGPVVDSIALVAELKSAPAGPSRAKPVVHFLNLGGLGIRDLAFDGRDIIVLAGPVSTTDGPFALYRWRPRRSTRVQIPHLLQTWPYLTEHPEGICLMKRKGRQGLLIVYDSPDDTRIKKTRYRADWIALTKRGGAG